MFDKIVKYSIHHKLVVGILVFGLAAAGAASISVLPIDAVPDITNNQVVVLTQSPTMATQEVEQYITTPLEQAFVNIQNLEDVRSISRQGLSVITLVFKDNIDIYLARQLVSEQIKIAEDKIPTEFGKPELAPITTGLGEIYQYTIEVNPNYNYDLTQLRTYQDWIVKRQLAGIEGVIEISSFGGYVKQYEIAVNEDLMANLDVSISEIFEAVKSNNANTGGSYIEKNDQTYFIRGEGTSKNLDDLGNIVIKNKNGIPVLIKDVSEPRISFAKRFGAMTKNGKSEAVGGIVLMLKGADSEKTIKNVKAKIEKINTILPAGLSVKPFIDRTKLIKNSINTVVKNLIEGGVIVIFVLVLLMGSLKAGLIVASVIPITMMITIGLMNIFGISANLMSLGAIDFGLLVDCSVIVVESVLFQIHQFFKNKTIEKSIFEELVLANSKKVLSAALFGGIIILIVYLPILSLTGIEGKMFKPMAQTVSLALVVAILLSISYVPVCVTLFLRGEGMKKFAFSDHLVNSIFNFYFPLFNKALNNQKKVIGTALFVFIISIILFMNMGGEFIPNLDEGDIAVDFQTPSGTSLTSTINATLKAQKALLKNFPEIDQIVGRVGSSEVPTDPMPPEMSDLMINLKDHSEWTSAKNRVELSEKMNKVLDEAVPGTTFEFTQPIQMRFNEMIAGSKSEFAIKIFGNDLDILSKKAQEIEMLLNKVSGTQSVKIERIEGRPQINVKYDKQKLAQFGISVADLNFVLKTSMAGENAGLIFEDEKRFDLQVRKNIEGEIGLEELKNLKVKNPNGGFLKLENLADINYLNAPPQISHENSKRRIIIGVAIANRDLESYAGDVEKKVAEKIKLPTGYFVEYGGSFENLQLAKKRLIIAVPISLLLIFMMLYFSLNSIKQAALVFSAIPFSAIGGIFALVFRGMPFSISAGVGFIALFGVAVLNGLVLISYFKQSEEESLIEKIKKGVSDRFRPVLITAFVASLGFLPMALSTSAGAEVQKPLATVVIGGLVSATILTLFVLPIFYFIFNKNNEKI